MSSQRVTTKTIDYAALVRKNQPEEQKKPETVYQFSNGNEFKSTDNQETGIYRRT